MGPERKTARNLVEEAKKRILLLLICVFGLAYLMSQTSSSVWINLPAAASLIIFLRYISLDLDIRRRTVTSEKQSLTLNRPSQKISIELPKVRLENSNWRRKVNSPAVEIAIDHFTRHIISEWVTDLWYSRITPDKDGPEELVQIMNDILGEISCRARDINLIDLLTRDIINLICNHLELYRTALSKIGQQEFAKLPADIQDTKLRVVLAAENSLHPGLFSVEAEHKVLQHLMTGLISFTFKPEDLQCSFFRYTVRELLACAVIRPILNLANPRIVNEKIESLVLSFTNKAARGVKLSADGTQLSKANEPSRAKAQQLAGFQDPSAVGVELVQLKQDSVERVSDELVKRNTDEVFLSKDPKNSISSLRFGEWGQVLDAISQRKTQALAPEHLENMWAKGRNYKNKETANEVAQQVVQSTVGGNSGATRKVATDNAVKDTAVKKDVLKVGPISSRLGNTLLSETTYPHTNGNYSTYPTMLSYQEKPSHQLDQEDADTDSSYPTEDDENNNVTGLDSPGTRVWDSKNKTKTAKSRIRHPLESSEVKLIKKSGKIHASHPRTSRTSLGRKRHRQNNKKVPIWQEIERSSFLLGDGQDILNSSKGDLRTEDLSDDSEVERWAQFHSGATTSPSMSSISVPEACNSSLKSSESLVFDDSFLKLRCEVLGANVVKSGSVTFAVYSIGVTDADNNSWSIKRRFRHFEELHKRLKEFPEYNLSLPPKHFLSSGLDVPVVQERCKLLDRYLKKLLQLPTVSGSIEVWDFLSVDSQTYMFSDSLSVIQTLSVDMDDKPFEKDAKIQNKVEIVNDTLHTKPEHLGYTKRESSSLMDNNLKSDRLGLQKRNIDLAKGSKKDGNIHQDISGSDSGNYYILPADVSQGPPLKVPDGGADGLEEISDSLLQTSSVPTIPTEWVAPNLSVPILDLVDVIFQLQDGGWIRRKAFWVAKQVLQLGMGDAFDDWLIEKIQLLRRGSVIASAIQHVEQILWPDGIFITKHPNRRRPTQQSSPSEEGSPKNNRINNQLSYEQQLEALRRAKFVHELIIDKAPATLVGLVGKKEYERCTQDIYFFLQSSVCLKQLAFELLELLLLAAFPELDDVVRQCHEQKEQFGKLEET